MDNWATFKELIEKAKHRPEVYMNVVEKLFVEFLQDYLAALVENEKLNKEHDELKQALNYKEREIQRLEGANTEMSWRLDTTRWGA